jgi:predicted TIM-barrel fold metal-dependent hydrolase
VAWKALAAEELTRRERMKASAELLREWIKDDWQGALDTMMKETPDDFALLVEFQPCFASHAEDVWTLIETKRYGILTKYLRNQWVSAILRLDEDRIRQLAATLPEPGKKAVQEILHRKKSS